MHQTADLYEARCEIARLRSLLPSENVSPRDSSPIETVTVREGSISSPKGTFARRDVTTGVYVRERDEAGEAPTRTFRHTRL